MKSSPKTSPRSLRSPISPPPSYATFFCTGNNSGNAHNPFPSPDCRYRISVSPHPTLGYSCRNHPNQALQAMFAGYNVPRYMSVRRRCTPACSVRGTRGRKILFQILLPFLRRYIRTSAYRAVVCKVPYIVQVTFFAHSTSCRIRGTMARLDSCSAHSCTVSLAGSRCQMLSGVVLVQYVIHWLGFLSLCAWGSWRALVRSGYMHLGYVMTIDRSRSCRVNFVYIRCSWFRYALGTRPIGFSVGVDDGREMRGSFAGCGGMLGTNFILDLMHEGEELKATWGMGIKPSQTEAKSA
jgi:hypothetical protein